MGKVSVILPIYNEEKKIRETFNEVSKFSEKNEDYTFIFVDDGSKDNTNKILRELMNQSNKNIKLVSYINNSGKGYAIKTGIKYANGDYICFTDGDLAYSLDHLKLMNEKLKYFDMVLGKRGLVSDNIHNIKKIRKIFGKTFNTFSKFILGIGFDDTQAGLKGFKGDIAKKLFSKQKIKGFSFDAEIIYLAKKYNYKILEIPARVSNGHSYKISKVNLFKDSIKMFFSLLEIRLNNLLGKYD